MTRNKCEVRIYTTEGGDHECPVVGEYLDMQETTVWFNVCQVDGVIWPSHGGKSKAEADNFATSARIACIKVTFTEGEGLE